jgi:hypothetical protein
MRTFPASLELGTILHDYRIYELEREPVLCEILRAYRDGLANQLWPRTWAVKVAFEAAMQSAEAYGSGNRAKRRMAALHSRQTAA